MEVLDNEWGYAIPHAKLNQVTVGVWRIRGHWRPFILVPLLYFTYNLSSQIFIIFFNRIKKYINELQQSFRWIGPLCATIFILNFKIFENPALEFITQHQRLAKAVKGILWRQRCQYRFHAIFENYVQYKLFYFRNQHIKLCQVHHNISMKKICVDQWYLFYIQQIGKNFY